VKLGLLKGNEPYWNRLVNLFWFLGILSSLLKSVYLFGQLLAREKHFRDAKKV
jgi:hypothetical protein